MTSSTDVVGIDLFPRSTDVLSDKVNRAAQARALVAFAKRVQERADADLERDVRSVAEATGSGGFTKRVDGVKATLTDPQPKPRVTDADEFEAWWIEQEFNHEAYDVIEVDDHLQAVKALSVITNPTFANDPETLAAAARDLASAIHTEREVWMPENALDSLTESGRWVATDDGLIDMTTGEAVPGVSCHRAKQILSVTPDKASKKRNEAIIASYFGVEPAALERGDA